jgi:hypothetical protein
LAGAAAALQWVGSCLSLRVTLMFFGRHGFVSLSYQVQRYSPLCGSYFTGVAGGVGVRRFCSEFEFPAVFCLSKAKEVSSSAVERDDIPFFKRLILLWINVRK